MNEGGEKEKILLCTQDVHIQPTCNISPMESTKGVILASGQRSLGTGREEVEGRAIRFFLVWKAGNLRRVGCCDSFHLRV